MVEAKRLLNNEDDVAAERDAKVRVGVRQHGWRDERRAVSVCCHVARRSGEKREDAISARLGVRWENISPCVAKAQEYNCLSWSTLVNQNES